VSRLYTGLEQDDRETQFYFSHSISLVAWKQCEKPRWLAPGLPRGVEHEANPVIRNTHEFVKQTGAVGGYPGPPGALPDRIVVLPVFSRDCLQRDRVFRSDSGCFAAHLRVIRATA
jgi:hypothetical protein